MKVENWLEHWAQLFRSVWNSSAMGTNGACLVGTEPVTSQLECKSLRVPNRPKELSCDPASFRLLTLLIINEFLVKNSKTIPHYLQNDKFEPHGLVYLSIWLLNSYTISGNNKKWAEKVKVVWLINTTFFSNSWKWVEE